MAFSKNETVERMIINIRPSRQQDVKNVCLLKPCGGCGSMDHSLIEIKSQGRTRSGRIVYGYGCPMVQVDDLYTMNARNSEDKLNISFYLSTKKCISQCGNNISLLEQVILELDDSIIGKSDLIGKFKEILQQHCEEVKNQQTRQENLLYDDLLSTPCVLCAQPDHTMLVEEESRSRGKALMYNCPIAYYTDWESTHREQPDEIYRVCPSKLAEKCNYYQMDVIKACTDMVTNNHNRTMTRNLSEVQLESLKICEKKRPGFCITRCEGIGTNQLGEKDNEGHSYSN